MHCRRVVARLRCACCGGCGSMRWPFQPFCQSKSAEPCADALRKIRSNIRTFLGRSDNGLRIAWGGTCSQSQQKFWIALNRSWLPMQSEHSTQFTLPQRRSLLGGCGHVFPLSVPTNGKLRPLPFLDSAGASSLMELLKTMGPCRKSRRGKLETQALAAMSTVRSILPRFRK